MNYTPEAIVDRNLRRACELAAVHLIVHGTNDEIEQFADTLHRKLDEAIEITLKDMETRFKIEEAIKHPKIAL